MANLKVTFYGLNSNAEDINLGNITLIDGQLKANFSPESHLKASDILGTVIHYPKILGGPIGSRFQPEKWMKSLYLHYKSAYMRATKAEVI